MAVDLVLLFDASDEIGLACNRQMKGVDLEGLNLDELLKLEQLLDTSLRHVTETKVCTS